MFNRLFIISSIILLSSCSSISNNQENQQLNTFNSNNSDCNVKNYKIGNNSDIETKTSSSLLLMGGGKDVDDAFRQMIKDSGGGDFIIIRSSGADGYNNYLFSEIGGINSVETLIIDSKEKANCLEVSEKLKKSEAVFIAGGDQSKYYTYWKNTPIHKSLEYLSNIKKIPLGGTSAGMAILGEFVYTAENASVNSEEVLKNPLTDRITIKNDFLNLPFMKGIITDTHFAKRNRQGRIISFMANAITNKQVDNHNYIKGIAADENTSLIIDSLGNSKVLGTGNIWFFNSEVSNPEICSINQPLTWNHGKKAIKVQKVSQKDKGIFHIPTWKVKSGNFISNNYFVEKGLLRF